MEKHAKKFWTEVAMDIIEELDNSDESLTSILFKDNYRNQPYQDNETVLKIAQILDNLNLDI